MIRTRNLVAVLLATLATSAACAQYQINWHTVDGGGVMNSTGAFQLSGTIGQPDANSVPMTGGTFSLVGGFWNPTIAIPCDGDIDGDRFVGSGDLGILLSAWQSTPGGDLNGDGQTDSADLGILLANWNQSCP